AARNRPGTEYRQANAERASGEDKAAVSIHVDIGARAATGPGLVVYRNQRGPGHAHRNAEPQAGPRRPRRSAARRQARDQAEVTVVLDVVRNRNTVALWTVPEGAKLHAMVAGRELAGPGSSTDLLAIDPQSGIVGITGQRQPPGAGVEGVEAGAHAGQVDGEVLLELAQAAQLAARVDGQRLVEAGIRGHPVQRVIAVTSADFDADGRDLVHTFTDAGDGLLARERQRSGEALLQRPTLVFGDGLGEFEALRRLLVGCPRVRSGQRDRRHQAEHQRHLSNPGTRYSRVSASEFRLALAR